MRKSGRTEIALPVIELGFQRRQPGRQLHLDAPVPAILGGIGTDIGKDVVARKILLHLPYPIGQIVRIEQRFAARIDRETGERFLLVVEILFQRALPGAVIELSTRRACLRSVSAWYQSR